MLLLCYNYITSQKNGYTKQHLVVKMYLQKKLRLTKMCRKVNFLISAAKLLAIYNTMRCNYFNFILQYIAMQIFVT